ncbi:hypothetical protein, partial [Thermomonospora echinospora]
MTEDTPRRGRPLRLLDERVRSELLEAIEAGATIEAACAAAGITSATYRSWMARGRQAQEAEEAGETVPDSEEPFLAFL